MVIKGKARGGPVALANHLERRDTNERVSVLEVRGVTARDVLGALREMDCMGSGAMSERTLYHAAINSAPGELLTGEQKQRAADRLEKELGFQGQPRIIVEHFKKDREHMHVVFLRIDTDRMVAIPDSHNYRKHEIVARDLEREFGHQHVQGVHVGREGKDRPSRTPHHHEMQQAERTGLTPQQAKEQVTELWKRADSGRAFAASLTANGWVLARGDKRDFVLVDRAGESHSLARRIEGAKAADVRERMSDVDLAELPSVSDAKAMQRQQADPGRTKEKEKEKTEEPQPPINPVMLKVQAAPHAFDPAKLLQPIERSTYATANKKPTEAEAPRVLRPQKSEASRKKVDTQPPPSRLKRLGGAATVLYDKARGAFVKKPEKAKERSKPKRAPLHVPAEQFAHVTVSIIQVPSPMASARSPASSARPTKPKLSREELDRMIGRQLQQRKERDGPSR